MTDSTRKEALQITEVPPELRGLSDEEIIRNSESKEKKFIGAYAQVLSPALNFAFMDAFIFRSHWLLYVACFIFMLPYWDHIEHVCIHKVNTWWMVGFYGLSFIVCVCMMVGSTYQTFLYAAF